MPRDTYLLYGRCPLCVLFVLVTHPKCQHGVCEANARVRICEQRRWELAHKIAVRAKIFAEGEIPGYITVEQDSSCVLFFAIHGIEHAHKKINISSAFCE